MANDPLELKTIEVAGPGSVIGGSRFSKAE